MNAAAQGGSDRLGIDFISVLAMPPLAHVALAAELGCGAISLALEPFTANPHGYPFWSLRTDAGLRRALITAARERDVAITLGEGFLIRPDGDVGTMAADLELMAEIGVARVNIVSLDPDVARSLATLAHFADLAAARGMIATIEFMPGLAIGTVRAAVEAVRAVGRSNFKLLLDAMHVYRSGAAAADLAAIDPDLIGYVQLCDVPLVSRHASYGEEARDNRLPPGEGELPLADFIAAMPASCIVGLEVPMLDAALAGVGPRDRLERCTVPARALLQATQAG